MEDMRVSDLSSREQVEFMKGSIVLEYQRRLERAEGQIDSLRADLDAARATIAARDIAVVQADGRWAAARTELRVYKGARVGKRMVGALGAAIATLGGDLIQKVGQFPLGILGILVGFTLLCVSWADSQIKSEDS
jgi:hypothetical protein